MRLHIEVEESDVRRLRDAYAEWEHDPLVQERIEFNVGPPREGPSIARIWECLVLALASSQQRSGPGSALWKLWIADPCPLSLAVVEGWQPDIAERVAQFLKDWGGIRSYNRIGGFTATNYEVLFESDKREVFDRLVTELWALRTEYPDWDDNAKLRERQACSEILSLGLKGIGNKQCRNWLQSCRLLRYEVPLDSRVLKFLKPMMPGVPAEQDLLGYKSYYLFMEDAVQELCRRAGLFPCVADAVMFLGFADSSSGADRKSP